MSDLTDPTVYILGTLLSGTDRQLENSVNGYNPVVVDKRGRRRFHGAFTGGFSAGYFNTAGSEHGYKAKYDTFLSSQTKNHSQKKPMVKQTPLDFMDDEDMATTKHFLITQQKFNSLHSPNVANQMQNKRKQMKLQFGSEMSHCLMIDGKNNNQNTIGIQLLMQCGWRTGTEVGDAQIQHRLQLLVKKQEKMMVDYAVQELKVQRQQTSSLDCTLFGSHILQTSKKENEQKHHNQNIEDIAIFRPKIKRNMHGIGFQSKSMKKYSNIGQKRKIQSSGIDLFSSYSPFIRNESKRRKLLPTIAVDHGLSALEDIDTNADVYDCASVIEYDSFILGNENTNNNKTSNVNHSSYQMENQSNLFVISSKPNDNFMQSMESLMMSDTDIIPHSFNTFKTFANQTQIVIRNDLLSKFKDFDLSVGSFLTRDKQQTNERQKYNNLLNDEKQLYPGLQPTKNTSKPKKKTTQMSNNLSSRFIVSEGLNVGQAFMGGMKAGLTLSENIPSKQNFQRKAKECLTDIRSHIKQQNINGQLFRFDAFLANKLNIELPSSITDNNNNIGNQSQSEFSIIQEKHTFDKLWDEKLFEHKQYLYPNHPRIKIIVPLETVTNMSMKEAAVAGKHGPLTRTEEIWMPHRLLCKRFNVCEPYLGMNVGNDKISHFDKRANAMMSGLLLPQTFGNKNINYQKRREFRSRWGQKSSVASSTVIKSKAEEIAHVLDDNTDETPMLLQLQQLSTWKQNLKEETKQDMNMFIDQILDTCDVKETKPKKSKFNLFKTIFENQTSDDAIYLSAKVKCEKRINEHKSNKLSFVSLKDRIKKHGTNFSSASTAMKSNKRKKKKLSKMEKYRNLSFAMDDSDSD